MSRSEILRYRSGPGAPVPVRSVSAGGVSTHVLVRINVLLAVCVRLVPQSEAASVLTAAAFSWSTC